MYITLIFLAIIMATVIGWLLKQTFNTQPWVADPADDEFSGVSLDTNTKTIALAAFLAVATSLFGLFISAYTERMEFFDWRPLNEPVILWVNTGFLVLASLAYQFTRNESVAGRTKSLVPGLMVAGIMTLLFLGGQLIAWQQINAAGNYVEANPATAFFLPADGCTRFAHAGWPLCLGALGGQADDRRRRGYGAHQHRALHYLLALPATRVGGAVRPVVKYLNKENEICQKLQ